MQRRIVLHLPLALAVVLGACGSNQTAPAPRAPVRVDAAALARHVSVLAADSMEGRGVGTPGGERARRYLTAAFAQAGLEPLGGGWEHPFQFTAPDGSAVRGVNLVGVVRGRERPDRYIVVTAHYDHVGIRNGEIYNGADDNASGSAALPVLASYFRANRPRHSLLFVALDAEESGLRGARALLDSPPVPAAALALNVNMDMVGRNAAGELYAAGTYHTPSLRAVLDSVAAGAPVTLRFGHDSPADGPQNDWTSQSDHGAFHARGIPFVYFGVEDHPDYHKPTDDVQGIMPQFHAGAVTTVLGAIEAIDRNLERIEAARASAAPRP